MKKIVAFIFIRFQPCYFSSRLGSRMFIVDKTSNTSITRRIRIITTQYLSGNLEMNYVIEMHTIILFLLEFIVGNLTSDSSIIPRNISKNYYLRPECPVHLTHGTLRTQTDVLDATSD